MADEIAPAETSSEAPVSAPKEKKTRGPRKAKVVAETAAVPAASAPVKKTRGRRKKVIEGAVVAAAVPETVKSADKPQRAKRGPRKVEAVKPASDGFADLLKLEEENQKLRKALSDKLRAENADLRKKLGLA